VTLADLPPLRDRLLFVGLRPSVESVAAGHYHVDAAGQAFWERLMEAEILAPGSSITTADDALVSRGHGLTDLVKVPGDGPPPGAGLAGGVGPLWQKIAIWRPAAVVFIQPLGAEAASGRPPGIAWGRLTGVALAGRPCLLLPGPELAPAERTAGTAFFRDLAGIIEGLLPAEGARGLLD
jgi:uracil-DNA glycosylase